MRCLPLLITLLPFALIAASPRFDSYQVTLHPIKKFARTKIPKTGLNWKMEERLHYSGKAPLNFADKYTLFDIGCGTGCLEYCLIDRTTGVVYPGTDFTQDFPRDYRGPFGLQFRRNSSLLVVYHAVGFEYPVHISYYVLDGTKVKLLHSDRIPAPEKPQRMDGNVHDPELQRLTAALDAATTQTDMNAASKKISEFWDAKLASVESRIAQKLDGKQQKAFVDSKERWRSYRTREVQFRSSLFANGSVQPLVANESYSKITEHRVAELKSLWLSALETAK